MNIQWRAGFLSDLLDKAGAAALEPEEQAFRSKLICKIPEMRQECIDSLKEILATRKNEGGKGSGPPMG